MNTTYQFKEAFMLMTYASEDPRRTPFSRPTYRVWNSRDGVTPFNYPINGEMCVHVYWNRDECKPDHVLSTGDLFFRDKTPEEAQEEAERRIASFKGTPYEIDSDDDYTRVIASLYDQVIAIPVLDIFK